MTPVKHDLNTRVELLRRWGELKAERASWMAHWQELSRFYLPRSGRYFTQDRNRGQRRHNSIYDNTGTRAVRVLAAGMMSGMTSPARPWFRLATPDEDLNKHMPVKLWLAEVTKLMLAAFAKSNTYRALHGTYAELGVFGTSAKILAPDFRNVIHHHSLTAGEYAIAVDDRGHPNTIGREFEKTVAQIVGEYGYENCSITVRNLWDRGTLGAWVPLIQLIQPRAEKDRDTRSKLAKHMPWASVTFEQGGNEDRYLRESGYEDFPALVSRWDVSGGDIYGNSPGMEALGDCKQLQQQQLRKGQAIDYQTKPPLQAPTSMKNNEVEMLPGGITYYDGAAPGAGIRTAFDVNLRLDYLLEDIRDVRERVKASFFADIWLMLEQASVGKMTATEVAERKEEKLLMLGPTAERLHNEELTPLVDTTFQRLLQAGALPPPPQELNGMQLNVDYISMLAQAQRAVSTNAVDRFVANLGQIAVIKPGILDKFNEDAWVDEYADMTGVNPTLIVADDKVALVRRDRAERQAAQLRAAQANVAADTAQKLANSPTGGADNALTMLAQGAGSTLARGAPGGDPTAGFTGYT